MSDGLVYLRRHAVISGISHPEEPRANHCDRSLHAILDLAHRHEGNPLMVGVIVSDAIATANGPDRNRLDVAAFTERLTTLVRRTTTYQGNVR